LLLLLLLLLLPTCMLLTSCTDTTMSSACNIRRTCNVEYVMEAATVCCNSGLQHPPHLLGARWDRAA
jgi:hypothetical protein